MTSNTGGATNEAIIERNADGTVEFTTDPENIDDGTTKAAPACERTVGATPYEDNCTTYTYSTGNLTGISPPNGAGNLAARAYTYDGFGRLSTMNNGRGFITTYTYDPMDRTKTTTTSKAGDTGVTYTYDQAGNQTARTDATGTVTYRYDKLNRLVVKDIGGAATDCTGGPTATRLCYGYDQASNLVSLGDGRGTTTYHYSPIGLLDEVNEHTGRTIVMSYDDDQRRVNTWYATNIAANGTAYPSNVLTPPTTWAMRTLNDLDGDGRMTRTRTWRASSSTDANRVADLSYSYKQPASLPGACSGSNLGRGAGTDAGRRTSRTDNETALTQTYCYDGAGRLLVRIGSLTATYLYTYDLDGNRKSDTVGSTVTNYTYNAANQLNNSGYTYDNAGNQLAGGDLTAAAYNGYDQAASMTPTGGTAISLAAAGTTNTELVTQGTTTLRNGVPGVQALTTGGTTSYLQLDPKGGLLSIVLGSGTTNEYYYVLDGQSSVIGLVDAAGTERAEYTYDPYGAHDTATALGTGGLPNNPYRYASGRVVATNSSGNALLYQYGERFYNPTTGRWTQQDNLESLGDPAQGNRYTYVGGDPINSLDPLGRYSWDDFTSDASTVWGYTKKGAEIGGIAGAVTGCVIGFFAAGVTCLV